MKYDIFKRDRSKWGNNFPISALSAKITSAKVKKTYRYLTFNLNYDVLKCLFLNSYNLHYVKKSNLYKLVVFIDFVL